MGEETLEPTATGEEVVAPVENNPAEGGATPPENAASEEPVAPATE